MNTVSSIHTAITDADYARSIFQCIEPQQVFPPAVMSVHSISPTPTKLTWTGETPPMLEVSCHEPHIIYSESHRLTGYDVLVGRHRLAFNHPGNKRFRVIVSMHLARYHQHPDRKDRSRLIAEIVETVEQAGGCFLKATKPGQLVEISEKEKRNKVGHALRDAAAVAKAEQNPARKEKQFMKQERLPLALEKCITSWEVVDDEIDFDTLFM
jgi:hypothetical protein